MHYDLVFRLIAAAQLLAVAAVRAYFGAPGAKESLKTNLAHRAEPIWLTTFLGLIALLHFGAIFVYLANPIVLRWSSVEIGAPIRRLAIALSCLGVLGEIWAAVSIGASYSPTLRVSNERALVTAGPYRWIRHPLYAFWILVMTGWALAAGNWFILLSGTILILVLRIVRVPREEAMMAGGFGDSYRQYIRRTGRFVPRFRPVQPSGTNCVWGAQHTGNVVGYYSRNLIVAAVFFTIKAWTRRGLQRFVGLSITQSLDGDTWCSMDRCKPELATLLSGLLVDYRAGNNPNMDTSPYRPDFGITLGPQAERSSFRTLRGSHENDPCHSVDQHRRRAVAAIWLNMIGLGTDRAPRSSPPAGGVRSDHSTTSGLRILRWRQTGRRIGSITSNDSDSPRAEMKSIFAEVQRVRMASEIEGKWSTGLIKNAEIKLDTFCSQRNRPPSYPFQQLTRRWK